MGELAERVARELGAEVVAIDISPRIVEIACGRGVDARMGDVQALPFADGEFDCVVANWVLYLSSTCFKPDTRISACTSEARHWASCRARLAITPSCMPMACCKRSTNW